MTIGYSMATARQKSGRYHKVWSGSHVARCSWTLLSKRFPDSQEEALHTQAPRLTRCRHVACWGKGQANGGTA